ncbi:MAG TPA: PqqD family protein [Chitinispirillaceae bacterium]|nr:PqqD family protein [Chitinispirillaceae bacterium]
MHVIKQNDISVRKIQGEIFILDRKNSGIHTFNKVGTFIWEHLQSFTDIKEIAMAVVEQFDVDEPTATTDTIEFIRELKEKELIYIDDTL